MADDDQDAGLLKGLKPEPNSADQSLLAPAPAPSSPGTATKLTIELQPEHVELAHRIVAAAGDAIGGFFTPPKPLKPTGSHPAAQALMAGVLQALGAKYKDRRMLTAGEELAQRAMGLPAKPTQPAKSPRKMRRNVKGKRRR